MLRLLCLLPQGFDIAFYGDGLVEMLRGTTMGG